MQYENNRHTWFFVVHMHGMLQLRCNTVPLFSGTHNRRVQLLLLLVFRTASPIGFAANPGILGMVLLKCKFTEIHVFFRLLRKNRCEEVAADLSTWSTKLSQVSANRAMASCFPKLNLASVDSVLYTRVGLTLKMARYYAVLYSARDMNLCYLHRHRTKYRP